MADRCSERGMTTEELIRRASVEGYAPGSETAERRSRACDELERRGWREGQDGAWSKQMTAGSLREEFQRGEDLAREYAKEPRLTLAEVVSVSDAELMRQSTLPGWDDRSREACAELVKRGYLFIMGSWVKQGRGWDTAPTPTTPDRPTSPVVTEALNVKAQLVDAQRTLKELRAELDTAKRLISDSIDQGLRAHASGWTQAMDTVAALLKAHPPYLAPVVAASPHVGTVPPGGTTTSSSSPYTVLGDHLCRACHHACDCCQPTECVRCSECEKHTRDQAEADRG